MRAIVSSLVIEAPVDIVWAALSDLATHNSWMSDARAVVFVGEQRRGQGTVMRVPTRMGPFTTTDTMKVVEWEEGRLIGVEHVGMVKGTGRFTLSHGAPGTTEMTWSESLRFPWWLGGIVGATVARPFLRRIWAQNLARFKRMVEVA